MKQSGRPKSYPSRFALKLPDDLRETMEQAARRRFTTGSEFIRQAVIEKLEREQQTKPAA
jgi:metal-responsive CopG/Arc/MetJ family transcriptional regulator